MTIRSVALRALAAGALLALAAPAAAAQGTTVSEGGAVRSYVRSDPAATLAGVALFVDAGLDRQDAGRNGIAALVAQTVLETPLDGVPLVDAVERAGGSIAFAVTPEHVRFYLEAPPAALPRVAALAARAFAAPAFDRSALAAARAALGRRIAGEGEDPRSVGLQMLRQAYYAGGSGMPSLGEPGALAQLSADDARAFFARWYVRGDAFVAAVGRTGAATDAAAAALGGALPAGETPGTKVTTRPYGATPRQIVAQRDVGAPYVVVGYAAPALGDPDFPAALVIRAMVESLLGPAVGTGVAPFRTAGVIYGYDAAPAQLAVWVNGGRTEPAVALASLIALMRGAAAQPIPASAVRRYVDAARGEWALETQSLDERAFAVGNAVTQGLSPDVDAAIAAALPRVTGADVARAAKRWFQRFDVALVVPRSTGQHG